jgi:DNA-binding NarL/FixJ family response regulator
MMQRCLIVDDSPAFLASARALLESQGMVVAASVSTAEAALAAVEALQPDFALVDVELAGEDGLDLARRLVGRGPPLRVILVSSYEFDDVAELVAGSGAAGFISKTALGRRAIDGLLGS